MQNIIDASSHNIQKVIDLAVNSALASMKSSLRCAESDLSTKQITDELDLTYDHWICCIVVAFKGFSVTFSVHFTSKAARHLASLGTGKNMQDMTPKLCHDFMREYCNLTAGSIKERLRQCDFEVNGTNSLMLPSQEPSFDVVKLDSSDNDWLYNWMIEHKQSSSLICSAKIQVDDPKLLTNLEKLDKPAVLIDDSGDVEFL
jgi:hypothetical protein